MVAMLTEGVVGLWQGLAVGSIALTGWALGGLPEALASAMVAWRFSGSRTLSQTAERRAQRGVALSFWLTAPYIAAESVHHLLGEHHAETSVIGMALTAASLVLMPILGRANHSLAERLDSAATAGEGTQNYLCGAQAAAVLVGLAVVAVLAELLVVRPGDRPGRRRRGDLAGRQVVARRGLRLLNPARVVILRRSGRGTRCPTCSASSACEASCRSHLRRAWPVRLPHRR